MDKLNVSLMAKMSSLFANELRMTILMYLLEKGDTCVGKIVEELGIKQSTVSNQWNDFEFVCQHRIKKAKKRKKNIRVQKIGRDSGSDQLDYTFDDLCLFRLRGHDKTYPPRSDKRRDGDMGGNCGPCGKYTRSTSASWPFTPRSERKGCIYSHAF